ncbi:MAG: efflux RND transporter periplasmic adaptor subunit [Nitrospirota bacterium]|nr:efflux RND transporter periplasmic adaptor subunit [Nitrospirota bacterium]
MTRKVLPTLVVLIVAMGIGLYAYLPDLQSDSSGKRPPATVEVIRSSLQTRVSETGTIQPSKTIEIKSQFSGEIAQLFVSSGQAVKKGELLAIIRQESSQARQVAQLREAIQEERLNVKTTQREWVRSQTLFKKGFIAQQELETSEDKYQRALLRLELAERQLLLALGGNEELFKRYQESSTQSTRPEEFQVRSPSNGTILEILVHSGEIITSGTATFGGGTVLMQIADLSHMVVKANINEVNIPRVLVGQSVDIRLDALPGQSFQGTVLGIATQGVRTENIVTYEVTIAIDTPHKVLKPMLTANVDIVTKQLEDVLTIPLEALRVENGDDVVEVLIDGAPKTRKVRVAFRTDTQAVITQGIQEHDQLIIPSFKADEPHK